MALYFSIYGIDGEDKVVFSGKRVQLCDLQRILMDARKVGSERFIISGQSSMDER